MCKHGRDYSIGHEDFRGGCGWLAAHPEAVLGSLRNVPGRPHRLERGRTGHARPHRSEEHTSELQSLAYLVCRLLLEKKKIFVFIVGLFIISLTIKPIIKMATSV